MPLSEILLVLLILAAIALCIYLIVSLKKINQSIESINLEVNNLKDKIYPLLNELTEVSQRVNAITEKVEGYINGIEGQIFSFQNKIEKVKNFTKTNSPENRIQNLIHNLLAIKKGLSAFWEKFYNK